MPTEQHHREHPGFEWDHSVLRAQRPALRALEIACAGGHNLALIGPPGTGKTLLALRAARLLERTPAYPGTPPLRAPHHTVSIASMIGAGDPQRLGEAARAHNGILLLDEIDEFPRIVLEALREPLNDGIITNARPKGITRAPARFLLLATLNATSRGQTLVDSALAEHLHLKAATIAAQTTADRLPLEPELRIRERVCNAQRIQLERSGTLNGQTETGTLKQTTDSEAARFLELAQSSGRFGDTDTALHIARTISDLRGDERISATDIAEALSYRPWPAPPHTHPATP